MSNTNIHVEHRDFLISSAKNARNLGHHDLQDDEIIDFCNRIQSISLSQFAGQNAKRINILLASDKSDLLIYPKLEKIPETLLLALHEEQKKSRSKPKLRVDLGPNKSAKLFMKL